MTEEHAWAAHVVVGCMVMAALITGVAVVFG